MDKMIMPNGKELCYVKFENEDFGVNPTIRTYILDINDFESYEELSNYIDSVYYDFNYTCYLDELTNGELYLVEVDDGDGDDEFSIKITKTPDTEKNVMGTYKLVYGGIVHKKPIPEEDIRDEEKVTEYVINKCVTPYYTSPKGYVIEFRFEVHGYKSVRNLQGFGVEHFGTPVLIAYPKYKLFDFRVIRCVFGDFGIEQATFNLRFRYR